MMRAVIITFSATHVRRPRAARSEVAMLLHYAPPSTRCRFQRQPRAISHASNVDDVECTIITPGSTASALHNHCPGLYYPRHAPIPPFALAPSTHARKRRPTIFKRYSP